MKTFKALTKLSNINLHSSSGWQTGYALHNSTLDHMDRFIYNESTSKRINFVNKIRIDSKIGYRSLFISVIYICH